MRTHRYRRRSARRPGRVLTGLLGTVLVLVVVAAGIGALGVRSGWISVERRAGGAPQQVAMATGEVVQPGAVAAPAIPVPTPVEVPMDSIGLPPVAGAPLTPGDSAAGATPKKTPLDSLSGLGVEPGATAARGAPPAAGPADVAALRGKLAVPVRGVAATALRDDFDQARGGGSRRHEALDILAPRGTPVVAATDGRVVKLFDSEAGGLTVYQADASNRYVLLYGHLDRYEPGIAEGQAVRQGQVIGYVGSTGNASADAPHLHFAVARSADPARWWGSGTPVNPYLLLKP
ncbi:M23 family metallopeptidase [Roseisolibacter sp. H3M3-2]|uniref:M23 family metallopeptidase n=1 Tax=Roseisolibacter sp. H3M3-2 TaxID=3031323 RepID=UPI0023DA1E10|nr:M23 family metallopeptidase [Roseisolibacter sp. H3M3-2]MDF1503197.1 M23 family metallopeptidase [Roseisolibacter sp. H3M3-2]